MDDDVLPPTADDVPPAFLIGIAGCSSSRETTLALANTLGEIFAPFVDGQAEAGSAAPPGRLTVFHQDDYSLPRDQWPRASLCPRLPEDEDVMAGGGVRGDGTVVTADTDRLEAVDWSRLGVDVEGFLNGGQGAARVAGPRGGDSVHAEEEVSPQDMPARLAGHEQGRGQRNDTVQSAGVADGYGGRVGVHSGTGWQQVRERHQHAADLYGVQRDAIKACATVQALKNAEVGFEGKYFKRPDEAVKSVAGNGTELGTEQGRPILGCRLGIVEGFLLLTRDAERLPPESQYGAENKSYAGDGELSTWPEVNGSDDRGNGTGRHGYDLDGRDGGYYRHYVDGTDEQYRDNRPNFSDLPAVSLWRKTVRRIKGPLQAQKDPEQDQKHPIENVKENREVRGNRDAPHQPKRDSRTLRHLVQRIPLFARDSNRRHQQYPSESDDSDQGTGNDKKITTSKSDGEDVGGGEQPVGSEADHQAQPSSARGGSGFCDKSTCHSCKGKRIEGRGDQSPCRATSVPHGPPRDGNGSFTVELQGSQGRESEGAVHDGDQQQPAKPNKPGGPDHRSSMLWEEVLQRMDVRLFLVAQKDTAAAVARGHLEDVACCNCEGYRGHMDLGDLGRNSAGLRNDGLDGGGGYRVQCLTTDDARVDVLVARAVGAILERMVEHEERAQEVEGVRKGG